MRKVLLILGSVLAISLMSLTTPKPATAQISFGITLGPPGPHGSFYHAGRGYYHRGGYYPYYYNGRYWRYRRNGIYFNYRHGGRYWRYRHGGRYYNYRHRGRYWRYRHKGRYYTFRERRCKIKRSGKRICWWRYY